MMISANISSIDRPRNLRYDFATGPRSLNARFAGLAGLLGLGGRGHRSPPA